MTKKILLFLILLSVLPLTQIQAQTYYHTENGKTWRYTVSGGNAMITGASPANGELNIPAKVGAALEYDVTAIGNNAFGFNNSITKLTANSVTTIGNSAFYQCTGLTSVYLPNATNVGNYAFYKCTGLTGKLNLPNVTNIGNNAFDQCAALIGLEFPKVTNIDNYAFQYCNGLTGKLDLPNVTNIGTYAFQLCSGLTGVDLPNVTTIADGAFNNCTGLTSVDLPNVTTIAYYAFYECSGLTGKLELPNVITIGNQAFQRCAGLTGVDLPNATNIGNYAFCDCPDLTDLELPNVITIGNQAFYSCRKITQLDLPNVKDIGNNAFYSCSGLTKLNFPKVTTIGNNAFYSCSGLTGTLELPNTLTNIGNTVFHLCTNLSAVTFESGTNLSSSTGTAVFNYCYGLQYIDMTNVTLPTSFTTSKGSSLLGGVQNYTMVYLPPSAPAAKPGQENLVVGNTCNKFVVYDNANYYKNRSVGCDYPILYPFIATSAQYQDRNLSGATCKTICLPYAATLPTGMRAYKLVAKTRGGTHFRFVSVGDGNGTFQLEANTPYLLRIISGYGYTNNNWKSNNVPVAITPSTMEVALPDGQTFFGGTTTNIDNATAASNNYYNLSSNTWYPIKTSQPNGYVHSMRAYIRTTGGTPAKGFAMVIDDDENATTDIDNAAELTEDELRSGKHTFYTLDGRRAGTNYDTLKSGEMYVVKGQKFYKF